MQLCVKKQGLMPAVTPKLWRRWIIVVIGLMSVSSIARSIDVAFERNFNGCWTTQGQVDLFYDEIQKGTVKAQDLADLFCRKYYNFDSVDQKKIALILLDTHLADLNLQTIESIFGVCCGVNKNQYIQTLIESKRLGTATSSTIDNLFYSITGQQEKNDLALLFLETSFEALSADIVCSVIKNLSDESSKTTYLMKLLESKKLTRMQYFFIHQLFAGLSTASADRLACTLFDNFFDSLSTRSSVFLLAKVDSVSQRTDYLKKILGSKKCETLEDQKLRALPACIDGAHRDWFTWYLLESCFDTLNDGQTASLTSYLSDTYKNVWTEKLLKKNSFVAALKTRSAKGPLFSAYVNNNVISIFDCIYDSYSYSTYFSALGDSNVKLKKLEQMLTQLADFSEQEYKKGNIVLFHGQQSQWPFLEQWFNELCHIKYGISAPQKFVRLRFTEKTILTDAEVTYLRDNGVGYWGTSTFKQYRSKVLFANLHVLANHSGSNSFVYVASNSDQTASESNSVIEENLKKIFAEFGLQDDYAKLRLEESEAFLKLYKLYNEGIKDQGNIGRMLAISIPKTTAAKLAYSTTSGGPLQPIMINGKLTTDVVEISENFDQVPFANEYCIILAKEMCNPAHANNVGIKMVTFDSIDHNSAKFIEFKNEFKSLSNRVRRKYKDKRPSFSINGNIKNCVGYAASRVA